MPSTMSLNTRVHIVSKSGKKETITARELLARGTGSSFEAFQMLDEYSQLAEAYDAEVKALADKQDRKDHLPLGAHLLPQDYQDFIYSWNKTISTSPGSRWWNGIGRDIYRITNKAAWAQWVARNKEFRKRYAAEVEQLIAYQATHTVDEDYEEDEQDHDAPLTQFENLPSLPPSPIALASPELSEQPDTDGEEQVMPDTYEQHPHQEIPQLLPTSELSEQPDTDAEDEAENQRPKRPHNPIYTSYNWPSPLAKVFVQKIRGNNSWDTTHMRIRGGPWNSSKFRTAWVNAGNTEFKLTHDNCMRYLAHRMALRPIELLDVNPQLVHSRLIGEYGGVPGYFIKRHY